MNLELHKNSSIPNGYGDNKIVLMSRDPHTLFSYWEIQAQIKKEVEAKIKSSGHSVCKNVLRVYDVTEDASIPQVIMDLEISDNADSWYINGVASGKEWMVDIGFLASSGEFFTLARSNATITPSNKMSEICDEEWMCPKELYSKLFVAAVGKNGGKSSFEFPSSGNTSRMSGGSGSFIFEEE